MPVMIVAVGWVVIVRGMGHRIPFDKWERRGEGTTLSVGL